jgi:hypothetical protein
VQPRAVEQHCHEPRNAVKRGQQRLDLPACEHHRQPLRQPSAGAPAASGFFSPAAPDGEGLAAPRAPPENIAYPLLDVYPDAETCVLHTAFGGDVQIYTIEARKVREAYDRRERSQTE